MNYRLVLFGSGILCLLAGSSILCSSDADTFTTEMRKHAIEQIAQVYEQRYVYPEMGRSMAQTIRRKLEKGQYESLIKGKELARQITTDLRAISPDFHLTVAYVPDRIQHTKTTPPEQLAREEAENIKAANFGITEAKVLPGQVGYLRMNSFDGSQEGLRTAAAALQFLRHCPSFILDLRYNPGGDPAMVQLIASHFLDETPLLLDEFHYRKDKQVEQLWSLPFLPGERLNRTDLFILIDPYTFSSAEGLAYDLQALKRARIVGTQSAGGAHAVETTTIMDSFLLFIPVAYSKNPITKENFQGKGVKPDVVLKPETALQEAHVLALETRMDKNSDPRMTKELAAIIEKIKKNKQQTDN